MESILQAAHSLVKRVVQVGDIVVDATVGNGHDTRFLAECVGPRGSVFGFDIQQLALDTTAYLLKKNKLDAQVRLIKAGHEKMDRHIDVDHHGKIAAAMFNLGYMPRGDKRVVTRVETTIAGVRLAASMIRPGGIVSIVAYRGHPGGRQEAEAVDRWAGTLDQQAYEVMRYEFINQKNLPPFLLLIERL